MNDALVLAIGNSIRTDDGAGPHAVERSKRELYGEAVEWMDGGTLSFTLLPSISGRDALVVVDAADLGEPSGTVSVAMGPEMDRLLSRGKLSTAHEVSLTDLLATAALVGQLPVRRALVCIQPEYTGWGTEPTETVARAIPKACDAIREILEEWGFVLEDRSAA